MTTPDLEAGARAVARRIDAMEGVVPAWDWRSLVRHHRERVAPAVAQLAEAGAIIDRLNRIDAGEVVAEDDWLRLRAAQCLSDAMTLAAGP